MPEGFGFKAWISTEDGVALPEYGIETDLEKKEIRCWIPSEAGKKFKVMWDNLAHYNKDTNGMIAIDGIKVGGKSMYKTNSVPVAPLMRDYVSTSPTTFRQFAFSELKLTDDDSLISKSSAHQIGSISLQLRVIKAGKRTTSLHRKWFVHEQHIAHEKSNKGVVHCVGFTQEQKRSIRKKPHRDFSVIQTLGTFVFKYRPLDVLQANGIAPREPYLDTTLATPPPPDIPSQSSKKRKADAVKKEDNEGIIKDKNKDPYEKIEFIRARLRKLEREKEMEELREQLRELEGQPGNAKRVKAESRPTFIPGEVIDLT